MCTEWCRCHSRTSCCPLCRLLLALMVLLSILPWVTLMLSPFLLLALLLLLVSLATLFLTPVP